MVIHRYSGVLEAVRVARAGFPQRYLHEQFIRRYVVLAPGSTFQIKDAAKAVQRLVMEFGKRQLLDSELGPSDEVIVLLWNSSLHITSIAPVFRPLSNQLSQFRRCASATAFV